MKKLSFSGLFLLGACAQLHHIQLSDIDLPPGSQSTPIEIKVSETGVSLEEAKNIAKAFTRDEKTRNQMDDIQNAISMFQMGPKTGNPVYVANYTEKLAGMLRKECPAGRITGLMSVRETRKYPVISGEIIRIKGFCVGSGKKG